MMEQNERIIWIDFTKAVVMLLVIIGHSDIPVILHGAICSFHMPLFFFLSGYTTKCSETKEQVLQRIKKTAKNLLITAYLLWSIRLIIYLLIGRVNYSLPQIVLSAIWAGGDEYQLAGLSIPAMGMTWFLVTLFILRNAYDILQYLTNKKHMTLISFCVAIMGMMIGLWIRLPFSFDLALLSFAFYHCGQLFSRKGIRASASKCVASVIFWGGFLLTEYVTCRAYLGMTIRRYPVLCISCAMAGCLLCIYVCQLLCKRMPIVFVQPICEIGQHSILLFAIHFMDGIWYPLVTDHITMFLALMIRLLVDLCLFFAILFIIRNCQRRIRI